jgi:hypothetical protein
MRERLERKLAEEDEKYTSSPAQELGLLPKREQHHSLGWLADLGTLLWGHREVCRTIKIEQFAYLNPLPAHRYLAYLAREGLVTEIISTNYDCCIERAFNDSFGFDGERPIAVIRNLADYRQQGGCQSHRGQPRLRLYKINGCAGKYEKALKNAEESPTEGLSHWEATARSIILTERQMQDFRDAHWAKGLLQDRGRCKSLFFCGFGSEEPQVRHAVIALAAEFENPSANLYRPDDVAKLANAPFLAAYDKKLSFPQIQILSAFFDAHTRHDSVALSAAERVRAWSINVFSGSDDQAFRSVDGKLPAD